MYQTEIRRKLGYVMYGTSNPCDERLLTRGRGLNALALCFLVNTFAQLKVKRGKWKIISCHSEDEIRRISIFWETNANPCDSSFRSERQVLCHTALDAVSHKYSAFTSSPCDRGSESAMTIPILPLEVGATHVENLQAGIEMPSLFPLLEERGRVRCQSAGFFAMISRHCEPRSGVAIQHPKHLDCFVVLRTPRNDCNELFNPSTFQPFNQNNKLESEV